MFKKFILPLTSLVFLIIGIRIIFDGQILVNTYKKESFFHHKLSFNSNSFNNKFNGIITGDSRTYYSFNPYIIKSNSKVSFMNMALPSNSYSKKYLSYIKNLIPINKEFTIIIALTPESLTRYEYTNAFDKYNKSFFKLNLIKNTFWPMVDIQQFLKWGTIPAFKLNKPKSFEIYHFNGWLESYLPIKDRDETALINHYKFIAEKYVIKPEIVNNIKNFIVNNKIKNKKLKFYFSWISFSKKIKKITEKTLFKNISKDKINNILTNAGAKQVILNQSYISIDGDHLSSEDAKDFSSNFVLHIDL